MDPSLNPDTPMGRQMEHVETTYGGVPVWLIQEILTLRDDQSLILDMTPDGSRQAVIITIEQYQLLMAIKERAGGANDGA